MPIEYSGFVWASMFGWLFFRENVTVPTLAGTALIIGGCWLVTRRDSVPENLPRLRPFCGKRDCPLPPLTLRA